MKKLIYLIALFFSVASCVYPFEMETGLSDGRLVVVGDIVLGEQSTFTLSLLQSLDGDEQSETISAEVSVESSTGARYQGVPSGAGSYVVDLSSADKSGEYRFHARVRLGGQTRTYSSEWLTAAGQCSIDDLYYYVDSLDGSMCFAADISSGGSCRYYDISYQETWEYTSDLYASFYYVPFSSEGSPYGSLERYLNGENIYYCWNSRKSSGVITVGTGDLVSDRLSRYDVVRISNSDQRISVCYRLDLVVSGISEDTYRYRSHMSDMSSFQGDLFSPVPSEIRGNIRCEEDEDEQVVGYVGVTTSVRTRVYERDSETKFYKAPRKNIETEPYGAEEWPFLYNHGMLVVGGTESEGYYWAKDDCVDCRLKGGTKQVPEGWPTGHK